MNNPFALWNSMLNAGRMVGETLDAAQSVISSRSETIAAATRNPLRADVTELGLMVSEKSAAFAKAGKSMARDWHRMQREMLALGTMWADGLSVPAKAMAIMARSQRLNEQALASGIRALKPIHATATANKRRLGKRR